MKIVMRAQWGFSGWTKRPASSRLENHDHIALHYCGASHQHRTGAELAQWIDGVHKGKGWYGIGYHRVVDLEGMVLEGRDLDMLGSHILGHNDDSWGILLGVGGDQEPTPAMLSATLELIADIRATAGKPALPVVGHRDLGASLCPGEPIYEWIGAGLPAPDGDDEEDDDGMKATDTIKLHSWARAMMAESGWEDPPTEITYAQYLEWSLGAMLVIADKLRTSDDDAVT